MWVCGYVDAKGWARSALFFSAAGDFFKKIKCSLFQFLMKNIILEVNAVSQCQKLVVFFQSQTIAQVRLTPLVLAVVVT